MLGIVLINYHSENEIIDFLANEIVKITIPFKIVIVNNSFNTKIDSDLSYRIHKATPFKIDKDIFILNSEYNLGYAKANNRGAVFLMDKFEIQNLLFSNNDIEIVDGKDIENLIKTLSSLDKIGGIGPRVTGKNGIDQSPHQYISFYRYFGWILFRPLKGKLTLIQKGFGDNIKSEQTPRICYWVSGCFMLVKAKEFVKAGMFDPYTFLYCEEKILAERFLKNGLHFFYEPAAIVHHHQNDSYSNERKREIANLIFQNDCYYYKTYRGIPGFLIWMIRFVRKISKKRES
jgi:GT2 family glycosyltransferase